MDKSEAHKNELFYIESSSNFIIKYEYGRNFDKYPFIPFISDT